jgi:glutamate transport system permease protein
VALLAFVLIRLAGNNQLDGARWAVLFDPNSGVPQALFKALLKTLQVAAVGMVLATAVGLLLAVGRLSDHRWVRVPVSAFIEFFRAIPLLVVIFALYFVLPKFGVDLSAFAALTGGLVLYNSAVLAEIFRAGILSVDRGQREAAFGIGLRKSQVMSLVLLPQAVRRMLPVLIAQLVVLLKDSSLGFIIGYFELLRQARSLVEFFSRDFGSTYTFQLYVAAGLLYIVVNVLLSQLAKYAEGRTRRSTKAAGTGDAELPVDVQMGGGGGAAPPV